MKGGQGRKKRKWKGEGRGERKEEKASLLVEGGRD